MGRKEGERKERWNDRVRHSIGKPQKGICVCLVWAVTPLEKSNSTLACTLHVCVCVYVCDKRVWIQHRDIHIGRYLTMSDCKLLHRKPGDKASSPFPSPFLPTPSLKLTSKLTICSYWVPLRSAWNLDKQSGGKYIVIELYVHVSWEIVNGEACRW